MKIGSIFGKRKDFSACCSVGTGSGAHAAHIQWVPRAASQELQRPEREGNSLLSTVEMEDTLNIISAVLYIFELWFLIKHKDNF
jgi:hypothetical protein